MDVIEDNLEEADEVFEVLLVSPEGTITGRTSAAHVTIRDSGRGKKHKIKSQLWIFEITKQCNFTMDNICPWWFNLYHHRRVLAETGPGGSCPGGKGDQVGHLPPTWIHSTGETPLRH